MTGWSTTYEIRRPWVDTEDMRIGLPQRKLEDLREWLGSWLCGVCSTARMVLRPQASSVSKPESNWGGGDAWGRLQKVPETER